MSDNCGLNTGLPISGATGALYFRTRDYCSENLEFNTNITYTATESDSVVFDADAKTITCSNATFVTEGFLVDQPITISGSTNNDKTFTIASLTETEITVKENIIDETDADGLIITGDAYIKDSNKPFNLIGYEADDLITVSGSTSNNNTYTVTNVDSEGVYVFLKEGNNVTTISDVDVKVTLSMPAPGRKIAGVQNWEISYETSTAETSTFDSGKYSEFEPIRESWSGSADKIKIFGKNIDKYKGKKMNGVFFEKWNAEPTGADPAIYWTGDLIMTNISISVNNNEVVGENMSFQGSKNLTYVVKEDAWPTATT